MTIQEIKAELRAGYTDLDFFYKGQRCSICPFNDSDGKFYAYVSCGGKTAEFHDLEELMNAPFFDGKSLAEIAEEIIL